MNPVTRSSVDKRKSGKTGEHIERAVRHGVLLANRYLITNEVIAVTASLKTHAIIEWRGIN